MGTQFLSEKSRASVRNYVAVMKGPILVLCCRTHQRCNFSFLINIFRFQINLGNMYYWGYGVHKDWEKSRELYREAAKTNKNAELLLKELEDEIKVKNNTDDP